jgi:hypothetical protein
MKWLKIQQMLDLIDALTTAVFLDRVSGVWHPDCFLG